jgi:hypothetical protein
VYVDLTYFGVYFSAAICLDGRIVYRYFGLILDIQYAGDIRNLTFMTLKCSKSLSVSYLETDNIAVPYLSPSCSTKCSE